jgi:hypothetical protein
MQKAGSACAPSPPQKSTSKKPSRTSSIVC